MKSERATVRNKGRRPGLELLSTMIQKSIAATNLPDLLVHVARLASEGLDAAWVTIWLVDPETRRLDVAADFRTVSSDESSRLADSLARMAEAVHRDDHVLRVRDLAADERAGGEWVGGPVGCHLVPVRAQDTVLGVLGLAEPGGELELDADGESFVRSVAAVVALAAQNATYLGIVRRSEQRLRETELLLQHSERMASLGEMNTRMAGELRNPLAAIGGLARRIARAIPPGHANHEASDLIVKEVQRLEALLAEYNDMARLSEPRRTAADLNVIVRDALDFVRPEVQRSSILLEEHYAAALPALLLDTDKIRRVMVNLLKSTLESVDDGDTIRVETYAAAGKVWVEIANTGERIAGEILDRLFDAFAPSSSRGPGVGLAVSQQIIKEHGGELRIRSDEAWSVIFTLSLPAPANKERRRRNRRSGRDRRRAA